ncbi:hypothetical protein H2O64_20975 [Kordia sp. YSTF-M3]|uniref:Replication protein n=1 Tax=Kordia aestuariivivens TaxID=2759037 RepID=A0ABR7QF05_9FLAO|nr:hypothetical protein [Kordia aestuariivivens]MBC8757156.1 hypothetical protein [Kordia aestuariivivens]
MQQNSNKEATNQHDSNLIIIKDQIPEKTLRPYMLSEDRLTMLQRYRVYVNGYNEYVKKRNEDIKIYNKRVSEFVTTHKLEQQAIVANSNFKNKIHKGIKVKWLSIKDYNLFVASQNGTMLLLTKKLHRKIKAMHERTFEVILWQYGNQLADLRNHLKTLDTKLGVSFPKAKITSTGIAHLTNDGQPRILYSSRTVQNHIYRLRDAGILTEYRFHGSKKPVNFFINKAIFCMHEKQITLNDNQVVKVVLMQNFQDKSEDTRTFTKEIIKKVGNVDNHSQDAEVFSFAAENSNKNKNTYKNTRSDSPHKKSNQNEGKLGGGENFPKNELSEYLRGQVLYKTVFLNALTEHHYDTYSFSASNMTRRLETEARQGAMSREEFRELLLQQFVKIAAPIWKGQNVYYGSWHNAYLQIDDEYLCNPNGSIPRKETLLYMFGFLVYRIGRAKRFFRSKKQYVIHFPSIYFDATRKQPSEGGFAYTVKWLKQYQKYQDLRATRKQQAATKAGARRRQKTNEEKVRDQIKLYIKGTIALPQVYTYIETNKGIPNYFITEVPRLLRLLTNKEFDLYE